MARERFVNTAPWRERLGAAGGLAAFVAFAGVRLAQSIREPDPGLEFMEWLTILGGLGGLAGVVGVLQSQWVAVDDDALTARAWPLSFRVHLDRLLLAGWVREAAHKKSKKSRVSNGAIWLAREDLEGELVVAKVLPGAPGPFLDKLAEVAPHVRVLPPLPLVTEELRPALVGRVYFRGRPLISSSDSGTVLFYAPLVLVGAWYLSSVFTWVVVAPIAMAALWLLWGAATPVVVVDERGVKGPFAGGTRLVPWETILAAAVGRGAGMFGGPRVFIWSAEEVPAGQPVPERVPHRIAVLGVRDPVGLYEEIALASGLRVEGDLAYRE